MNIINVLVETASLYSVEKAIFRGALALQYCLTSVNPSPSFRKQRLLSIEYPGLRRD